MAQSTRDLTIIAGETRTFFEQAGDWLRTDSLEVGVWIAVALGLYLGLEALKHGGCRIIGRSTDPNSWRALFLRLVQRLNSVFLFMLAAHLVASFVVPPGAVRQAIEFLFTIAAVFQGAIWLRELILGLVARRAGATPDDASALASAMGVIRILVNVAVWALAIILVLDNLGVNVTALVAGLGIGGIAIGLAAQGIFSDLFAALAILFDRPFRVGDTVQFGATVGTVEAIGLKTTRIRALSGEQVIVSNTKLLEQQISNLRRIESRRVALMFRLSADSDPEKLSAVPSRLRTIVEAEPKVGFGHALLVGVSPGMLDLELVFTVKVADFMVMAEARHRVIIAACRAMSELGLHLAELAPPRG
jgi:small-conductance mechanosensitive channel